MNQIAKSIIVGCTVFMFAVGPRAFGQVTYTNTTEQLVDGFGAAYAYWGADVENAPAAQQAQILGDLYSLKTGAGLSTIRLRVDPDIEPSQGDYDWSPLAGDGWYAQQAEALGVSKVWTTCWSPPAWMKSNDSQLDNGYVPASDYQAFADYLAAYCNQMKSLYGISIYRISPANEPDQSNGGNVGNSWSDLQFQQFVPYLYAENLGAGIMIPEESAWDDSESSGTLQNEPGDLATVAAHAYSVNENGSNYTPLQFATEYNKPVWETEVSDLGNDDESMTNGLAWAEHVQNAFVLGHVNAWHYWWGYDEKTSSGEGLLYYNTSTQSIISIPRRLYTIGNFARFVRPGFHLMGLSANTTSAGIYVSAFANAVTGEVVVVAINPNAAATNLSVSGLPLSFATPYVTSASQNLVQLPNVAVSGGTLSVSLAASSVTTFDGFYGPGPAAGTYTLTNANSNLNLDINSASTSAGASAIQATSNGDTDQVWNLSVNADGTYQITNANSGLALDVVSASPDVNAQVVQNPANGNDSQKWLIEQSPTGTWSLFNLNSRMKLDVLNSSTSAGAAAVQTAELCLTSQVWKITATGGGNTAPYAPTGLTATAGNGSVALSWAASFGATSYSVYRGTSSGGESATPIAIGVTATSYTDNSVTNGTTYYYEVTATNAYGTSGDSNEAGATPAPPPAAPTNLTAMAGNTQDILNWTASAGATGYSVYRGTSSGGESATPIATGVTSTSYTDSSVTNGTTYYYEVTATNSSSASGDSNEASATPGSTVTVIYDDFSQPNYDTGNHTPYDVYLVDMWDGAPGGGGLPPNDGTTPNHTVLGADLPGGVWQFGGGADTDYDCIEVGNLAGYGASNIKLTGGTTTVPYASVHNNENVALSLNGYNANTQLTVSVDVCPQSNACYVGFDSALNTANNFTGLKVDTSGGVSLIVNGSQVGSTIAFTGTWSQNTASQLTFTVNTSTGAISGISLQGSTSNYSFTTTAFTASATPYLAFFTPGGGYALYAYLTVTASPLAAPPAAPTLAGAVSRKTQGGMTFDIPINVAAGTTPVAGPAPVECRTGATLLLVVTFNKAMTSGSAALGAGTATVGAPAFSGDTMTIPLSGVANAQALQVNLSNLQAQDGSVLANAVVTLRELIGDVNGDGAVNTADITPLRASYGTVAGQAGFNARADLNTDGSVNTADVSIVSQNYGKQVP